MSLKKVSRWSEHEQVTQTEEGRLRRRVQRGMLKPHLVTKRWKWRESHQKSTSWVLTYPAVIWSEKRQTGTWKHLTVPFPLRKQCLLRTEGQTWNELFKAISKLAGGSGFLLSIGHWRLALGKWLAGNSTWLQFEFFTELLCTFASSFFCLTELGQNERQFVFLLFCKYSLS